MNAKSAQIKTASSVAAALTLTAAGGVSALFLTFGQASSPATATVPETVVVTEYVDQFGRSVSLDVTNPPTPPEVILVTPDGATVATTEIPATTTAPTELPMEAAYEEEYEEDEPEEYEAAEGAEHQEEEDHD